jgi:hypothetical protein
MRQKWRIDAPPMRQSQAEHASLPAHGRACFIGSIAGNRGSIWCLLSERLQ